ncbi:hypothetical protein CR513_48080, partial [Mucuna pruriens]
MSQRIGTKLFVNRLSFYTTQEQLKTLFSPFGKVTKGVFVLCLFSLLKCCSLPLLLTLLFNSALPVDLVIDPRTKRPKGFGFVSYDSEIEAERAMKAMNGR